MEARGFIHVSFTIQEVFVMSEKRCYTVKELQAILGVSRPSVYELLKRDVLRSSPGAEMKLQSTLVSGQSRM